MKKQTKKKSMWLKEIVLAVLLLIEVTVTTLGYTVFSFALDVKIGLIVANILTLFTELTSIINRFEGAIVELRNQMSYEHDIIKGEIDVYKNLEKLEYVTYFEGDYISTQSKSGAEIWIISNSVAEPPDVLDKVYKNILKGIKYYYIIPNDDIVENDLRNSSEMLRRKSKKESLTLNYIQDDLFDFMPTTLVDILIYCNPNSTDYLSNMKIFYSFQDNTENIYYKKADLTEKEIRVIFQKMKDWKMRDWKEI